MVAAMSDNCVIGRDNKLPWHIPEDLKRFKSLTYDHPVIMGRKTYESILDMLGKPLPGRTNIVITRGRLQDDRILIARNIRAAIGRAKDVAAKTAVNEIFIIGGAQVFSQGMLFAHRIYLTRVHKKIKGDTYFPHIEMREWKKSGKQTFEGNPSFTFLTLDRTV